MSKTLLFVRLEFASAKKYFPPLIIIIYAVLSFIIGYISQSHVIPIVLLIIMIAPTTSSSFSVSDKFNLNILYCTLSIKPREVVFGRYIFIFLINCIIITSGYLLVMFSAFFSGTAFALREVLTAIPSLVCVFCIYQSFQWPIFFKLGYTKAKIMAFMPQLVLGAVLIIVSTQVREHSAETAIENFDSWYVNSTPTIIIPLLLVFLATQALSMFLSVRFYSKREF